MSTKIDPSLVPLSIFEVQPISSFVTDFWQRFEGKMPSLKEMCFMSDALVIPNEKDRTVLTITFYVEGFWQVEGVNYKRFLAIGCTIEFILLDEKMERREFPRLLDIELGPFDSAISLAISITRGHLLPRLQGSLWPNFILPAISVKGLSKRLKLRDKLKAEGGRILSPEEAAEHLKRTAKKEPPASENTEEQK